MHLLIGRFIPHSNKMGGTSSALKPEVVNDLKNTTAFSHTEICDIYRQFRADCKNSDHFEMTLEDFTNMYAQVSATRSYQWVVTQYFRRTNFVLTHLGKVE